MVSSDVIIYYDTKEKKPHINWLSTNTHYIVAPDNLIVGDYLITDGVTEIRIEVKNGMDLLLSKFDGRLEKQIKALSNYEYAMVALVGDIDKDFQRRLKTLQKDDPDYKIMIRIAKGYPQSVSSIKTSAAFIKGEGNRTVPLCPYADSFDFQRGMKYIAGKLEKGELLGTNTTVISAQDAHKSSSLSLNERRLLSVAQIDGIGLKRARTILEFFDFSMSQLTQSTIEQLIEIPGIKNKLAQNIHDFYNRLNEDINEDEQPLHISHIQEPQIGISNPPTSSGGNPQKLFILAEDTSVYEVLQ